jgi:hypothetical protein
MGADAKRDKILDRVKKLLALSTSSNVNEAATAAAAAQKLMLEHRLTEADVSDTQDGQMFELSMGAAGFASRWKFVLVTAVARSFFCEAIGLLVGRRRKVRIVGRREDTEIAARVFRYLLAEINRLAKSEIEGIDWGVRDVLFVGLGWGVEQDPERYLESFRRGAVAAVVSKFRSGEEDFVASDSRALVIARRDHEKVRAYVGAKFTDTRKLESERVAEVDDLAFFRGYEQARVIVIPVDGHAVKKDGPEEVPDRRTEETRSGVREPGSVAEVFVKSEVRPVVDVVVTHDGSVPIDPAGQPGVPDGGVAEGDPIEGRESPGHGDVVQNVESFFERLKNWWTTKI